MNKQDIDAMREWADWALEEYSEAYELVQNYLDILIKEKEIEITKRWIKEYMDQLPLIELEYAFLEGITEWLDKEDK